MKMKWLYPACFVCELRSDSKRCICNSCYAALPWATAQQRCARCGVPRSLRLASNLESNFTSNIASDIASNRETCAKCLLHAPYFDSTCVLFDYAFPIDQWIMALKFHQKLHFAALLGQSWFDHFTNPKTSAARSPLPEALLPVPLHPKRLRERGFNQCIEIAKIVAPRLKIPLLRTVLQRQVHSRPQSTLGLRDRVHNMKAVFAAQKKLPFRSIAILDDVMTTGATVNALSHVCKEAGVERVEVWCCARRS